MKRNHVTYPPHKAKSRSQLNCIGRTMCGRQYHVTPTFLKNFKSPLKEVRITVHQNSQSSQDSCDFYFPFSAFNSLRIIAYILVFGSWVSQGPVPRLAAGLWERFEEAYFCPILKKSKAGKVFGRHSNETCHRMCTTVSLLLWTLAETVLLAVGGRGRECSETANWNTECGI